MKKKILVVEDDKNIQSSIKLFLEHEDYDVKVTTHAEEAITLNLNEKFDCVLLDLGLPDFSGFNVLLWIHDNTDTPVIIITAQVSENDVVKALRMGAKDYIRKPFGLKELLARIEVLLVQHEIEKSASFNQAYLSIDYNARTVWVNHEETKLTNNEYQLLVLLSSRPHQIFSRENLILGAFGYQYEGYERTVDTYIKTLRSKIEKDPKNPQLIKTVFGIGYQFIGDKDEK